MTFFGLACRVAAVAGAAAAALASGSSNANRPADPAAGTAAPPSSPMEIGHAVGLWKSNFGPVKIEKDPDEGEHNLRGVWVYQRAGAEVIGYFSGPLDGNVLQFRWHEPGKPADLVGDGYIVFDPSGQSFQGRWWTTDRTRSGEWTGRRAGAGAAEPQSAPPPDGPPPPEKQEGPAEQAPPPAEETI